MSKPVIKKEQIATDVLAMLAEMYPESASEKLGLESSLIDDYYIDSLKVAALSLLIDERFDTAIELQDFLLRPKILMNSPLQR